MNWKRGLEITAMVLVGIGTVFALAVAAAPFIAFFLMFNHPSSPSAPGPVTSR